MFGPRDQKFLKFSAIDNSQTIKATNLKFYHYIWIIYAYLMYQNKGCNKPSSNFIKDLFFGPKFGPDSQ